MALVIVPTTMPSPIQGDDTVTYIVKIYEAETAQLLEDMITADLALIADFPATSVGIFDIQYQVTTINTSPNVNNVVMSYSSAVTIIVFGAEAPP